MGIEKSRLITLVSRGTGSYDDAARELGIEKKSIGNWQLNERGEVTSHRILSAACRALMRQHIRDLKAGRQPMHVPPEDVEALVGLRE